MALLGRYNSLQIVKHVDFGLYLDGGADGEILLPGRYELLTTCAYPAKDLARERPWPLRSRPSMKRQGSMGP